MENINEEVVELNIDNIDVDMADGFNIENVSYVYRALTSKIVLV